MYHLCDMWLWRNSFNGWSASFESLFVASKRSENPLYLKYLEEGAEGRDLEDPKSPTSTLEWLWCCRIKLEDWFGAKKFSRLYLFWLLGYVFFGETLPETILNPLLVLDLWGLPAQAGNVERYLSICGCHLKHHWRLMGNLTVSTGQRIPTSCILMEIWMMKFKVWLRASLLKFLYSLRHELGCIHGWFDIYLHSASSFQGLNYFY